jgi:hypothetical protein
VPYRKLATGRTARFTDDRGRVFRPGDSMSLTVAIEVKNGTETPTRYDAVLDDRQNYLLVNGRSPRFVEAGGKRFVEADTPGLVFAPSTSALVAALAFNVGGFVVWLVAFWPCLRFTLGHSAGGAFGFGLLMLLFVVPLLFEKNQPPPRFALTVPTELPTPTP